MKKLLARSVGPALVALSLCLPSVAAQACEDGKSCPHRKADAKCECSCGKKGKASANSKAGGKPADKHQCGAGSCDKAGCDGKGCDHEHAHGHDQGT